MKTVITKPMCVVGDNKSTVRFEPSTPNNPFVEVSNQVYVRLKRANAQNLLLTSKQQQNLKRQLNKLSR